MGKIRLKKEVSKNPEHELEPRNLELELKIESGM